jgi:hypothetical protein
MAWKRMGIAGLALRVGAGSCLPLLVALPVTMASASGCLGYCYVPENPVDYTFNLTVVDATTGAPIPNPTFTKQDEDLQFGLTCWGPDGTGYDPGLDAGPDGGVLDCVSWSVTVQESNPSAPLVISAPGYAPQSLAVPSYTPGQCFDRSAPTEETDTVRLSPGA